MLGEDRNTRASITQAASITPGAAPLGPALDYLITCAYSSNSNELLLLAGNNEGAVGCFPVAEPMSPGEPCCFGGPTAVLSGAHDSVSCLSLGLALHHLLQEHFVVTMHSVVTCCRMLCCDHALLVSCNFHGEYMLTN